MTELNQAGATVCVGSPVVSLVCVWELTENSRNIENNPLKSSSRVPTHVSVLFIVFCVIYYVFRVIY